MRGSRVSFECLFWGAFPKNKNRSRSKRGKQRRKKAKQERHNNSRNHNYFAFSLCFFFAFAVLTFILILMFSHSASYGLVCCGSGSGSGSGSLALSWVLGQWDNKNAHNYAQPVYVCVWVCVWVPSECTWSTQLNGAHKGFEARRRETRLHLQLYTTSSLVSTHYTHSYSYSHSQLSRLPVCGCLFV